MLNGDVSVCKYLFNCEAAEIFKSDKFRGSEEGKSNLVEESLELLMKVNRYLLSQESAFALLDPVTYNNQCHLFALRAAQIQKKYRGKSDEEKCDRNEENRFLHLSLFLSYSLRSDKNTLISLIKQTMQKLNIKTALTQDHITFMRDDSCIREKIARVALITLFKDSLQTSLALNAEQTPLYRELSILSKEEEALTIEAKGQALYTYPKLAGVVHFVDEMAKEDIPLIVKVKVLTQQGAAGVIVQSSREVEDHEPVIVLEGFATDGSEFIPFIKDPMTKQFVKEPFTLPKCQECAVKCNEYFHRHVSSKVRHPSNEKCFYCTQAPVNDLSAYQEKISLAMESPEMMLKALGADFIEKVQSQFKSYFENTEKYPLLSRLFAESKPLAQKLELDMNHPTAFSACHAYVDIGYCGKSNALQLDMTHQKFLQSRGVL